MPRSALFALIALCLLTLAPAAPASETWLRIDGPNEELRSTLPESAIEYPGFIWLPRADAAAMIAVDSARVSVHRDPFALQIDLQRADPRDAFGADAVGLLRGSFASEPDFRLVQFAGPIKREWLDALRAAGVEPVQYLAPFAYIVWADAATLSRAAGNAAVRFAGEMPPVLRIPLQARENAAAHSFARALIHAESAAGVIGRLQQAGAAVVGTAQPVDAWLAVVELRAAPERFEALARVPGVLTVQQIDQTAGPRGEMSNQSVVGGWDAGLTILPGYRDWLDPTGLDGRGVVVGIVDGGIQETHPDLVDNMVPCLGAGASCSNATDSHGTHVAGGVAGTGVSGVRNGAGFLRGQGVAPGASLIEQRYVPLLGGGPGGMVPNGMLSIYRDSADSGAQLTNNSWGPGTSPQGYDVPTMEIDMISRDADPDTEGTQPVLAVWSIMNGNGDRNFGTCQPSSLGSPDEAKNLFAVGSTRLQTGGGAQSTDFFSVSGNSAHGPSCDGRQVPHIVAPGCSTDSTSTGSGYGLACGTSMASPVVSGAVALYWQQYRQRLGVDPSPAMVKAAFTPVAVDLIGNFDADSGVLGHRPDRKQGWGRLDLDAVINPPLPVFAVDQQTVLETTGESWQVQIEPVDPTVPVRIMLVWTDAPGAGTGGTNPAWVNDLDLVVDSGEATFLGNVFGVDGFSEAGGSADFRNNMEGVMLAPEAHQGLPFNLTVLAANLAEDAIDIYQPGAPRQDFALACYNCRELVSIELFIDGFESEL